MRYLYTIFFYLAVPFILFRLYWRGKRNPDYRKRWHERFAHFKANSAFRDGIWIHAVSMGEVMAASPLINRLLNETKLPITLTTTTPTGSARVQDLYGDRVFHVYFPYDLPTVLRRFLKKVQPKLVVVMETELWPNLYARCAKHKLPIVLANARLSPHSFRGYSKITHLVRPLLRSVSYIAAQTKADEQRYQQLGAIPEKMAVLGSIKFDINVPASTVEKGASIRKQWGNDRTVLIAASTHEGEEPIIFDALNQLKPKLANILLVLVPRHPDRFKKVIQMAKKRGYNVVCRSENQACCTETDVFIGDSIGEMGTFYAGSDIALVAGSLMPIGGHNMLEPAACGLPILTGPHVFNSMAIFDLLQQANVVFTVNDADDISTQVLELANNPALRETIATKCLSVVSQNRGACAAHFKLIAELLPKIE